MAYEVIISDPTYADLDNAVGYIAVTLGAPRAAASLVDDFESTIRLLAENLVDETARKVFVVAFAHTLRSVPEIISARM